MREALCLSDEVRFDHHVTEACKSIVLKPYDRCSDVVEAAATVLNVGGKYEGGDPAVEGSRDHPRDIFDYFTPLEGTERRGHAWARAA